MKFIPIFISLLFISLIFCEESEEENTCEGEGKKSAKECKNLKVPNNFHCCFIHVKSDEGESKGCTIITDTVYKDIKKYIEEWEKEDDVDIKNLDCNSNYLKISLLSLILIFL